MSILGICYVCGLKKRQPEFSNIVSVVFFHSEFLSS